MRRLPDTRVLFEPPGDWVTGAPCGEHPELFFPPDSDSAEHAELRRNRVARAKEICEDCPVRIECNEYAEAKRIDFGVWAGIDRERRRKRTA